MSTEVSPENERFIQDLIERGSFHDRGAVLDAGIELLRLRGELVDRIEKGHCQLKDGQYTDYDDASLRARFCDLEKRASKASERHG